VVQRRKKKRDKSVKKGSAEEGGPGDQIQYEQKQQTPVIIEGIIASF